MTTLHSGLLTLLAENEGNSRTLPSPGASTRREASDGSGNCNGDGDGKRQRQPQDRIGRMDRMEQSLHVVLGPRPQRAEEQGNCRSGRHSP